MKSRLRGLLAAGMLTLLAIPVQAQTLRVWGDDTSRQISDAPSGKFKAVAGRAPRGWAAVRLGRPPTERVSGPSG
jgi:hypothetical protein